MEAGARGAQQGDTHQGALDEDPEVHQDAARVAVQVMSSLADAAGRLGRYRFNRQFLRSKLGSLERRAGSRTRSDLLVEGRAVGYTSGAEYSDGDQCAYNLLMIIHVW